MAVFRIEKTRDYTVMSNHHLKDRTLTLKSKGLLSMMLSLPDEWNYTTRGLAAICREGVDSIGAALKELENRGYIRRTQLRDEKGKITDTEYVIYEMPQCEPPSSPGTPLPGTAKPYTENPDMGIPDTAEPCTENPAQLNTNQTKTDLSSTELSNPIQSNPPTPAGARMGTDRMGARECYREVILDTFDCFCKKVLKCEAYNGYREISRRLAHEVTFSELPEDSMEQLASYDRYPWEYTSFPVGGDVILIENDRLAEALNALPQDGRNILLMYFFLDMADREIAERMHVARRTVNARRQKAYRLLKELMGGDVDD